MHHAAFCILFELLLAIDVDARWTNNLHAKVRRATEALFANQVASILCKIEQVGTANVVFSE